MLVTLDAITDETADGTIKTFHLTPSQPFHFTAGQFTELTLFNDPGIRHDSQGRARQFTLSGSPTEPGLAITINFRQSYSSFKTSLQKAKPGATFDVTGAMGDFVLPIQASIPLVWIAGGIGITPFRSIAKSMIDSADTRDVTLFHVYKPGAGPLFENLFLEAGIKTHIFSADESNRMSVDDILSGLEHIGSSYFYVSGPETLVLSMSDALRQKHIPQGHIITDAFLGYH